MITRDEPTGAKNAVPMYAGLIVVGCIFTLAAIRAGLIKP